ncbi:hypothetical protein MTP99_013143 [Tenebrio molitor]|nr:hypothetical protein MTP99_013143 [Tenebrio molitor]
MTRFIRKYCGSCLQCAYGKGNYGKREGQLHPIHKPDKPMDTVHIDHVGPFPKSRAGNSYVLTIIDSFTKYLVVKPTKTLGSAECIQILREVFGTFLGYPRRIISDNGLAFGSRYFKEFVDDKQIKHVMTAVATPRANGQVERYHRTLLDALCASVNGSECYWDTALPEVVWGMNNTVNSSTKYSPYELMFSNKERLLQDLEVAGSSTSVEEKREAARENLKRAAKKIKVAFDRKRKVPRKYSKGDLVLWRDGSAGNTKGVSTKVLSTCFFGRRALTHFFFLNR